MPAHDWTRVDAGLFHHFHQSWTVALTSALNGGILPLDYFALVEQNIRGPIPDVLTLRLAADAGGAHNHGGGLAVADSPPRARIVQRSDADSYAARANRVTVRHRHGEVVAIVECVSPGNKGSRSDFRTFVQKTADVIRQGVNVLVVDLFPPTPRDPVGVHKAIWDEFNEEDFALPVDKPLLAAAYDAGPPRVAYVEPFGVGEPLPEAPLFLAPEYYVVAPLESTYNATWRDFPAPLKSLLEWRPTEGS